MRFKPSIFGTYLFGMVQVRKNLATRVFKSYLKPKKFINIIYKFVEASKTAVTAIEFVSMARSFQIKQRRRNKAIY